MTTAFPGIPLPQKATFSPYNSSFWEFLYPCQLLFLVASLEAIDKNLPENCTKMLSVASSSQSVAGDRSVQAFASTGDCPIPHESFPSKAAARIRSMAAPTHPRNRQTGNLYSWSAQYFLLTPSHSPTSIISATSTLVHSVSKPASNKSISTTFP